MALTISDETLKEASLSPEAFKIEMATHLYDIGRLTLGQARKLADLDQVSFQKELAKRNIYLKYDIEDLDDDLKAIDELKRDNP